MKILKKSCICLFAMIMMLFPILTACGSNKEQGSEPSNAAVAEQTLKKAYENAIAKKHWTITRFSKDSSGEYKSSSYDNIYNDGTNIKYEGIVTSSYPEEIMSYYEFKKLASSYEQTVFNLTSKTYEKSVISDREFNRKMSLYTLNFLAFYDEQKQITEDTKSIYIDDSENFNFLYCSELSQKQYNGYTVVEFSFSNSYNSADYGEYKRMHMFGNKLEFYILDGLCRALYYTTTTTTKNVADGSSTVVGSSSDKSKIIFSYHNSSQITFDKTGYTEKVDGTDE